MCSLKHVVYHTLSRKGWACVSVLANEVRVGVLYEDAHFLNKHTKVGNKGLFSLLSLSGKQVWCLMVW